MTKWLACLGLILGCCGSAHADVVYVWKTLSATVDGQPTNLTAAGEVTLTDGGFSQGFGQVTTTLVPASSIIASQVLDGVSSASFEMFGGPTYTTDGTSLVNLIATVVGPDLDVVANQYQNAYGGFFMNVSDTDDYANVDGAIYYGTDNENSPCYGPATPEGSHCRVTGVFEQVLPAPEPATLPLTLSAFGLLALIASSRGRGRARQS